MEKFLQRVDLQALQQPRAHRGWGPHPPEALGSHCPAQDPGPLHKGLGLMLRKSSPRRDSASFVPSTQVSAVPTVLAIKNGDVVDKFVGIKDEDQLEAFLKKLIG